MKGHVCLFFFRCGTLIRERSLFNNHHISRKKKKRDGYKGNYNHSLFKLNKIILWLCSNVISFFK